LYLFPVVALIERYILLRAQRFVHISLGSFNATRLESTTGAVLVGGAFLPFANAVTEKVA
jgi:hypothetical protein